jgi:hypothetical protein
MTAKDPLIHHLITYEVVADSLNVRSTVLSRHFVTCPITIKIFDSGNEKSNSRLDVCYIKKQNSLPNNGRIENSVNFK